MLPIAIKAALRNPWFPSSLLESANDRFLPFNAPVRDHKHGVLKEIGRQTLEDFWCIIGRAVANHRHNAFGELRFVESLKAKLEV
jgi:hypothetical protein